MSAKRKVVRCSNTLTAIKKPHIKDNMTTIKTIAACNRKFRTVRRFSVNPYAAVDKLENRQAKGCANIHIGAQNTTKQAGNLPDSEVFSRPKFMVLDVGIVYPQGRRHNLFCVLNPHIHPECLKSARDGFSVQQGTEAMTTVNTTTTPKAAPLGITPATFPGSVQRQIAIETALADALYYIRMPYSDRR